LLSFFGCGIPAGSPDVEFTQRALELVKELEMEIGHHCRDKAGEDNFDDERKMPADGVAYCVPLPKVSTPVRKIPIPKVSTPVRKKFTCWLPLVLM